MLTGSARRYAGAVSELACRMSAPVEEDIQHLCPRPIAEQGRYRRNVSIASHASSMAHSRFAHHRNCIPSGQ
jgi:hypothetical protein